MDEKEVTAILGSNVKKYRKSKSLTQEKLAAKLDVSTNYISDVERGKAWISAKTIARLSEVFDIEPSRLLQQDAFYEGYAIPAVVTKYAKDMALIIAGALKADLQNKPCV
jgi:transcriptional regulator with XRE-family HTH domain